MIIVKVISFLWVLSLMTTILARIIFRGLDKLDEWLTSNFENEKLEVLMWLACGLFLLSSVGYALGTCLTLMYVSFFGA